MTKNRTCWIVTEGIAGTENQCLGVAEALGLSPHVKRITLRQPWKLLSPWLKFECACTFTPPLEGPWPDLLIASGRKSVAAARHIKKASGGKTFAVQIQDPRVCPKTFDLVAVPSHDPLRGENVVVTDAAPNRVTPWRLATARDRFESLYAPLPSPRAAVLIGGNSKTHRMTPAMTHKLAGQLKALAAKGTSLMVTASRRTGEENTRILQETLTGPNIAFWDGTGENPYFGMLAWADYILVTSDSSSMLSEASTTGKPVYMIPLEGGSDKFQKLYSHLMNRGILRTFEGNLEHWTYEPLRDAAKIAAVIDERLDLYRTQGAP